MLLDLQSLQAKQKFDIVYFLVILKIISIISTPPSVAGPLVCHSERSSRN